MYRNMRNMQTTIQCHVLNVDHVYSVGAEAKVVKIHGDLEVTGNVTSQFIQEAAGFKEFKEEFENLKTQLQEYKEHVKILEKKLDELYYEPGGPIFEEAQTSFEKLRKTL
jgi:hypothetical protein